jgi:hypothetical protein
MKDVKIVEVPSKLDVYERIINNVLKVALLIFIIVFLRNEYYYFT